MNTSYTYNHGHITTLNPSLTGKSQIYFNWTVNLIILIMKSFFKKNQFAVCSFQMGAICFFGHMINISFWLNVIVWNILQLPLKNKVMCITISSNPNLQLWVKMSEYIYNIVPFIALKDNLKFALLT